jgi:hypothetical protein
MTPTTRAKSGTTRLSDVARKVVAPRDITSTGWPSVRNLCERKLGLTFDDWQHGAGRLIMAERKDGKLAAMIDGVGMSLPRQVGKTYLLAAIIFALCIRRPGLLVIWSAHHSKTHNETFLAMQAFAERSKIKPYIRNVYTGSGDEEVRFLNGSRILFGARERGFGRGIPGVDILVFDEAQILSDRALANMLATMNTSQFGLSFFIGTPPRPEDDSEVFERLRMQAYSGDLHDGAWIEFGAERGVDPQDRKQWAIANPSFPKRTPTESMLRLMRKLKPDDFLREGLGIWDEDNGGGALPVGKWLDLADVDAERGKHPVFGVDITEDRAAWIAVAWRRGDGAAQVMLANDGQPMPAFRVVDECKVLSDRWRSTFFASKAVASDLELVGVRSQSLAPADFTAGCGGFADALNEGTVHHGNQPALNQSVKAAHWRSAGTSGERAWQLKDSPEIGPLAAVTRALHGLSNQPDYDLLKSVW